MNKDDLLLAACLALTVIVLVLGVVSLVQWVVTDVAGVVRLAGCVS